MAMVGSIPEAGRASCEVGPMKICEGFGQEASLDSFQTMHAYYQVEDVGNK
jgi:hypothetical protein